jgi:hypothetical protein
MVFTGVLAVTTIGLYLAGERAANTARFAALDASLQATWQSVDTQNALNISTENARAAKKAAEATEAGVQQAKASAERQLRAYVGLETSTPLGFEEWEYKATLHLVNYGQTPANNVQTWSQAELVMIDHPFAAPKHSWPSPTFTSAPDNINEPLHVLFPGAREVLHTRRGELSSDEVRYLREGQMRLYWWGEVRYVDVFGERRKTLFSLFWQEGQWYSNEEGNDYT